MNPSVETTRDLVKQRIQGFRIGTTAPAHEHSFRVATLLQEHGYGNETCLAGLMHELIVPGGMTTDEFLKLGYSSNVTRLVELVTLPDPQEVYKERQRRSLNRLMDAAFEDGWAVKAAITLDDLQHSAASLPFEERKYFVKVYAPWLAYFLRPYQHKTLIQAYFKTMRDHLHARLPL